MKLKVKTKLNKKLRALVLSDLHIHCLQDVKSIKKFFSKFKNKFEAIFLVGDIVDASNVLENDALLKEIVELIKLFGMCAPTFIVSGNHDVVGYLREESNLRQVDATPFEKFTTLISSLHNVKFLDNETAVLKNGYTVSGIVAPATYSEMCKKASKSNELGSNHDFDFLNKLSPDNLNIVLCHFPNLIIKLEKEGYLPNANVCISGHTHNGCTQFRFLPIEPILDFLGQKNRGLITPDKSFKLKDTARLRGVIHFDKNILVINPAFRTLSNSAGMLSNFNWLFYKGYTEIEFLSENEK